MKKNYFFLILIGLCTNLFANKSEPINLVLAGYESPMGSERITQTVFCETPPKSWVLFTGVVANPVKDIDLNNTDNCYKVQLGPNHDWWANFLNFRMQDSIHITTANRYLHILHYRQVLNDNWMICLNTDWSLGDAEKGKLRFESQNLKAGVWEDVVIDMKYLMDNNIWLKKFMFGVSMDWTGARDNPGSDYYFDEIILSDSPAPRGFKPTVYNSFQNGKIWQDSNRGMHINAHSGQILFVDNLYYWIGEDRTGGASNGVSCYSSKDLYNWKYEGLCLAMNGVMRTDLQDIAYGRLIERPKVVYNATTGKFVMWAHWENGSHYGEARAMIAYSDKITGPFQFVKTFRPHNQMSRDQTLFQDTDGKAYQLRASEENATLQISQLSDDYLDVKDNSSAGYKRTFISSSYEAPTVMKYTDGKFYGIFSGTTGWAPNPARLGISNAINGDWAYVNNPCVDEKASTTYDSQGTYIYKIPNKENAYLFMGDRWNSSNVGASQYVWLPLSMRTGRPVLKWYENWDLSLFDKLNNYNQRTTIESGKQYYLLAKHSDKFLSLNGSQITQWKDDETKNLSLLITLVSDGWYTIQNASGQYLDAASGLSFAVQSNSDAQLWRFDLTSDNYYYLYNKLQSKVVDVNGVNTLDGATIGMYTKTAGAMNEMWGIFQVKNQNTAVPEVNTPSRSINVYPNPSNGNEAINILLSGFENENPTLDIIDLNGKTLYKTSSNNATGICIHFQGFQPGVYILKVTSKSDVLTRKIIISA